MSSRVDKLVGVYHFLSDRTPKDVPLIQPKPRRVNPWLKDGQAIVSRVTAGENISQSIESVLALLGPVAAAISRGDRVLVKPNYNSPDPPPGSTDLPFLMAVIELLLETGARVTIGESSGGLWRPTRNVFRQTKLYELANRLGVELIAFEDREDGWVRVRIDGDFLHSVTMPRSAYEADKLVYLPCLKTHNLAGYSGALKLAFGFVHPGERRGFHRGHLQQKLAEVSLCWQPDLIIMDGRRAFISGGPDKGEVVKPGILLASGDPVAIDVEAVKVLLSYKGHNKLPSNPWEVPQIAHAVRHGLGAKRDEYVVVV